MVKIKFVCFDYDGVFTNGDILLDDNNCLKFYNCKDGHGIKMLKNNDIKTGIISAHSIIKTNVQSIVKHLNIDYYIQGADNKLAVLEKWCKELNIELDEVAYIGDDKSDLSILKKLVSRHVLMMQYMNVLKLLIMYVKKGGDGCVREFIEEILDDYIINNYSNKIKKSFLYQIDNFPCLDIIINQIINCTGNIYFTGIGKSEIMANYCCNILKSIGIKTFDLNLMNLMHGDIGTIEYNDIVFVFSNSGNTKEIVDRIDLLQCFKIGIFCNKDNLLKSKVSFQLILPFNGEIKNSKNINCIPTNSSMSFMIFTNLLVSKLIDKMNININLYKSYHPAGNIGNNLRTVNDIIITEYPKIILNDTVELNKVLLEMTKYSIGCCFFVNENNNLLGLMTDGDIRRLLLNNNNKFITIDDINITFKYVDNKKKLIKELKEELNMKKYKFLPVIDNNKLFGIIDYRDIII